MLVSQLLSYNFDQNLIMIIGLNHLHSSFRYLVLLFIVLTIVDSAIGLASGKTFSKSSKLFALLGLIFSHVQLLVGLALYFIGDKGLKIITSVDGLMSIPTARFFAVEHISTMIIAIALITVGYSRAKRMSESAAKFKTQLIFYSIGLILIFAMIPWPFMKDFGTWM